ncbi:DUF397 domain-containing protein [Streptomyces noursei]|uniref:DUF397 domain-containing protein n=1 Tax=Streptomyces noursei TaxID=1971 RepID=A0A2N8PP28_STRNR|nr:DUF397 domain-containing protein [Streptomyces noursei]PNE42761.1 hypothetical protein AOB60_20420 [Streptomyces noursei]
MTARRTQTWVKSSYSNQQGGNCLEWQPEHARSIGEVLVRDSKNLTGPHLSLSTAAWSGLVEFAKTHG